MQMKEEIALGLRKWAKPTIDKKIRQLIKDLNKNGFRTWNSCQGIRDLKKNTHSDSAYIAFWNELPEKIKNNAPKYLIYIDKDCEHTIRSCDLDSHNSKELAILYNKTFVNRVYQLFELTPGNDT